jgi:hypothetical protein
MLASPSISAVPEIRSRIGIPFSTEADREQRISAAKFCLIESIM